MQQKFITGLSALFLILAVAGKCQAQVGLNSPRVNIGEKFSYGGNFALNFGSITLINISPNIGYRVTDRLTTGAGFIYQYLKYNNYYGYNFATTTLGATVFGRYRFLENVYGMAEYQNLSLDAYDPRIDDFKRTSVPIFFIGGGYLQNLGGKFYANVSILYDIVEDKNSPYGNPMIQAGVVFNP